MIAPTWKTGSWGVVVLAATLFPGCAQQQVEPGTGAAPATSKPPAVQAMAEVTLVPDVPAGKDVALADLRDAAEVVKARLAGVEGATVKVEGQEIKLAVPADADQQRMTKLATRGGKLEILLMPAGTQWDAEASEWRDTKSGESVAAADGLARGKVEFTGVDLAPAAEAEQGAAPGEWQVRFEMEERRKDALEILTGENVGRVMAIVMDGEVLMAPVIRSAIPGVGVIVAEFSKEEAADLAAVLNVGPLPVALRVVGQEPEETAPTGAEGDETDMGDETAGEAQAGKYDMLAGTIVRMETARGDIVVELHDEDAPKTVANFKKLIEQGFYDGLTFHRSDDMCIQGGCPEGTGMGGPGWTIDLEVSGRKNVKGALAMARSADPNSAGSQFYILKRAATHLDGSYSVFGTTVEGLDLVPTIRPGDKIKAITILRGPKAE